MKQLGIDLFICVCHITVHTLAAYGQQPEAISSVGQLQTELESADSALPVYVYINDKQQFTVQVTQSAVLLQPVAAPNPQPPVDPPTPPIPNTEIRVLAGVGIYPQGNVLEPGSGQRWLTDEQITDSDVQFILHRVRWKHLEPTKDKYQLGIHQQQIHRYKRAGKPYGFLVMTGCDCTPTWIEGQKVNYEGKQCVVPWAHGLAPQYAELCKVLADMQVGANLRMADDPMFRRWCPTGPTIASQEMHPHGVERISGYSVDRMRTAWRASLESSKASFPNVEHALALSLAGEARKYVPLVVQDSITVLGKQATYQHNALNCKASQAQYDLHIYLKEMARKGHRVAFEALCSAVQDPTRFGCADPMRAIEGNGSFATSFVMYPPDVPKLRALTRLNSNTKNGIRIEWWAHDSESGIDRDIDAAIARQPEGRRNLLESKRQYVDVDEDGEPYLLDAMPAGRE